MYIYKMFNPAFLSTFYPYPYRYLSGRLPAIYYMAPFIAITILALPLYVTYKKKRSYFNILVFGYGFFLANIIFVLQFISCGAAIMADRYSYIAYIGLFFLLAYFTQEAMKRWPSLKMALLAILIVWSGALSYLCYKRTFVWHNSETLLKDAIKKYPLQALLSYKWLGNYYMDKGDLDSALANYNVLTMLHAADAKIYDEVGNIYTFKGYYNKALNAFGKSLSLQNDVYKTYLDRSLTYLSAGDSLDAVKDYITAYRLNPEVEKVAAGEGFAMVQNREYLPALKRYNMLIKINPSNPLYYFYRGVALFGLGEIKEAADNWRSSLKFSKTSAAPFPASAYNLSVVCDSLGNDSEAVYYATLARKSGYKVDTAYLNHLVRKELRRK